MSRGATMSVLGLYNHDDTLFDYMQFPTGFTDAQKQNVIDNILVECAELEVLYPSPTVMKNIIGIWSKKELPYWDRVYQASLLEYNPIENYRRTENETIIDDNTEQHSGKDSSQASGSDSNTASGSDTTNGSANNTETNSGTDTTVNKIAGFDSGDLVDHDSGTLTHGHTVQDYSGSSDTTQYGRVDTQQFGRKDEFTHGEKIDIDNNRMRSVLAFGNIGVTTSQQMLTQELDIAKLIQVIPIIIEDFKARFCIMVY